MNEVLLPGRHFGSISSAVLVQVKGWQRSFHPSMKSSMAAMRSLTEVKLPRRMACRVMIEKKTSTRFSHDPDVRAWLATHPRIILHFTPASGSWLNMVEIFFSIITRQAIRRGSFTSVKDLIAAIGNFIDAYNGRCQPFSWTKDAEEILAKIRPSKN